MMVVSARLYLIHFLRIWFIPPSMLDPGRNGDLQAELFCAALLTWTIAGLAMYMRITARKKMGVRLAWPDYLSIVSFIFAAGFTFLSMLKARWGLGIPLAEIDQGPQEVERQFYLDLWADMWLYTTTIGLSKFVILGLYWQMFQRSSIRWPIRVLAAGSLAWMVARYGIILGNCKPISKNWDKDIEGECSIPVNVPLYALGIPHLLLEVGILACPLVEIKRLQLPRAQKFAVAGMFMSGVLVCVSATLTIVSLKKLNMESADLTHDGVKEQICAICDVNLSHLSTSLPLLRPMLRSFSSLCSERLSKTFGSMSSRIKSWIVNTNVPYPLNNARHADSASRLTGREQTMGSSIDQVTKPSNIAIHHARPSSRDDVLLDLDTYCDVELGNGAWVRKTSSP